MPIKFSTKLQTLHVSGKYSQILPMLIFGGVTGLAGLLALLLPETHKKRLPETIEEAEKLGRKVFPDLRELFNQMQFIYDKL